jgi:hypothetical protein
LPHNLGLGFIDSVLSWFVETTAIYNWLLALLIAGAIGCIFFILMIYSLKSTTSDWHSYTKDQIFGLTWRWDYDYFDDVIQLTPFCPHCDLQIIPQRKLGFNAAPIIEYSCDSCQIKLFELQQHIEQIELRVTREIHKKIRSGDWEIKN